MADAGQKDRKAVGPAPLQGSRDQRMPRGAWCLPAAYPFARTLARGLLAHYAEPLALAELTLILPSRRAVRTVKEAFLAESTDRALLLPRFLTLGDIEEEAFHFAPALADSLAEQAGGAIIPPALPPLTQRLLLARLVAAGLAAKTPATAQGELLVRALGLADELASFLAEVEREGLSLAGLYNLVPEELAAHWQETLDFLAILTQAWPAILAERQAITASERRGRLIGALESLWRLNPPTAPVLIAGVQVSDPASLALFKRVLALPQGALILPALAPGLLARDWPAIASAPTHPFHAAALLLQGLELELGALATWPLAQEGPKGLEARTALVTAALRPAAATGAWREEAENTPKEELLAGLKGLMRIDCQTPAEEAQAIALLLRKTLETPEKTAALVTPNRELARRVAAELGRWGIAVDDSAGLALAETPLGLFLRLVASAAEEGLAPVSLLALLKHPLAAGGEDPAAFRRKTRRFERLILRGPSPQPGAKGLTQLLAASRKELDEKEFSELQAWLRRVLDALSGLLGALKRGEGLRGLFVQHIRAAEKLAASDEEEGPARLWRAEAGELAANFVADTLEALESFPDDLPLSTYSALFTELLAGLVLRPAYGQHPRLAILGALEARLFEADLVVLAGLNEGTWPKEADPGPWLSRPLRKAFGLPPLERRLGLSAHDFFSLLHHKEVVMTRAARSGGSPTVPSRWLLRLDAYLKACGLDPALLRRGAEEWLALARGLDRPARLAPAARPAPIPPLEARPKHFSISSVETLWRDPYAFYAKQILKLKPLEPLESEAQLAEKGTAIHKALESFITRYPKMLPERAEARATLLACGEEAFQDLQLRPSLYALWWPRFLRAAEWFLDQDSVRREKAVQVLAEVKAQAQLDDFTISAKADRIERLREGGLALFDYKTGTLPGLDPLKSDFSAQLLIEALLAEEGAFEGLPPSSVAELHYWRLSGGRVPGEEKHLAGETLPPAVKMVRESLSNLLHYFAKPETPYLASPNPKRALRYNDYAQLTRFAEWAESLEEDE